MKKVIRIAFVAAIAGYGVYTNQKTDNVMSELMLANVEALANDEIQCALMGVLMMVMDVSAIIGFLLIEKRNF